jgi:hypothetical protein
VIVLSDEGVTRTFGLPPAGTGYPLPPLRGDVGGHGRARRREYHRPGHDSVIGWPGGPGGRCFLIASQFGFFAAVVTYPVASTNLRKRALVTSIVSMYDGARLTLGTSRSFLRGVSPWCPSRIRRRGSAPFPVAGRAAA